MEFRETSVVEIFNFKNKISLSKQTQLNKMGEKFSVVRTHSADNIVYSHMRRFTSTTPARGARAPNRALSNSCL